MFSRHLIRHVKERGVGSLIFKIIFPFFGHFLWLLCHLLPRSQNHFVIGSHLPFNDNPKYLYLWFHQKINSEKQSHLTWITADRAVYQQLSQLGYPVEMRFSVQGVLACIRAGTFIFSFQTSDINHWLSGGAHRVNLWHGLPLKNIEWKVSKGNSSKIYRESNLIARYYVPQIFLRPHKITVTTDEMVDYFAEAFRVEKHRCIKTGLCRIDLLTRPVDKVRIFVKKYENQEMNRLIDDVSHYSHVFMYMPTWRDNSSDIFETSSMNLELINAALKAKNMMLFIKLHSGQMNSKSLENSFSNITVLPKSIDVYPLLPFSQTLITDYSSVYFDYILMDRKSVLLFPFDEESYINNRDLAFDYKSCMPAKRVHTSAEFLNYFENFDFDSELEFDNSETKRLLWGDATEKCCDSTAASISLK